MNFFIKLMMIPIAFSIAVGVVTTLGVSILMLSVFVGVIAGMLNGVLAAARHGNAEAIWHGIADGFGGTVKFGLKIVVGIGKFAFSFAKGLI